MEDLKPIKNWEKYYGISENGKVWSYKRDHNSRFKDRGFWLTIHLDGCGYSFVALTLNGKTVQPKVHRLVAETFILNPLNLPQVNHKDGNKQNNHKDNLEWCTPSENILHAFKHGLSSQKGEKNAGSKLLDNDIRVIRQLGEEGVLKKDIATKFNVSRSAITNIIKRKRWKHIN